MNYLWNITVEDYLEVVRRAKAKGKQPGENIEAEFIEYMKEKGQKPAGATELTHDELLKEYASKGKSVLDIQTDDKGKQTIRVAKERYNKDNDTKD